MLALGELQMVGLPKNKFSLGSWRIFDPFMKYGHAVMLRTMKNLVVEDVLRCSENKHVELQANESAVDARVGFLEEIILKEVLANPGCSVKDCMSWVFRSLLDNDTDVNPGKYICSKIIKANLFDYWEWTETSGLLSTKLEIVIPPTIALELNSTLDAAVKKIETRMQQMPILEFYFRKFSKVIGREFEWWRDSS